MTYVYVVAADKKEAEMSAQFGWKTKAEAEAHLKACRFYGGKLHIYKVPAKAEFTVIRKHA